MTMTLNTAQVPAAKPPRPVTELVRPRLRKGIWPATGQSREEVWGRLAAEPFAPACDNNGRKFGLRLLLGLADRSARCDLAGALAGQRRRRRRRQLAGDPAALDA
ncbi:hypothetical protein [Streptomyces sp. NPDC017435]|uniref:hypothetical protein n=1 Tax=Streptomyces sp. NPDC017435 TaxID=3364995 RepID=UPI0037A5DEAD